MVADLTLPLPVHDLQPLPETTRQAELQRLIAAEFRQPFSLTHGPTLPCYLAALRRARTRPAAGHASHHRGWLVAARVFAGIGHPVYGLYHQVPATLSELPIQYADVVQWQQQCLATGALAAPLAYWRQHLASLLPGAAHGPPRPPMQTYQGAHQSVLLSGSCT